MDVLSDLLNRSHARGSLFGRWLLSEPWGLEFDDGAQPLSVHTVIGGELVCERENAPGIRVRRGDVLLVRGGRYRFVHQAGAPCQPVAHVVARGPAPGAARTYTVGGPHEAAGHRSGKGAVTELLCGAYTFRGTLCSSVLDTLTDVAVVASAGDRTLATLLALLAEEARGGEPGQQAVLDRLLDTLLVCALRACWSAPGAAPPAWYGALGDPVAGPALRALHANPARPWTVAELAAHCGVSRATLARRFTATVGRPPLTYLTGWRMELARQALRDRAVTVAAVAREVGYADAFAFAVAFKREVGVPPGRYRLAAAPGQGPYGGAPEH